MKKTAGILIFNEIEVLDFCGPFEVLSVTRLDEKNRRETESPFQVHLIAETREMITTIGGMRVLPEFSIVDCPALDILVVPGGIGTRHEMKNQALLEWIGTRAKSAELLTSVCTGALLLGAADLLRGKEATTHWGALDLMEQRFPETCVTRDKSVVEDGDVLTSAGISAGIDMALRIVKRYHGEGIARAAARYMEYTYPESDERKIQV